MKDVQEILKAEKQAEQIVAKAHKDAEKIILKARQDALELVTSGKEKIDEQSDIQVATKTKELERKSEGVLEESTKRLRKLEATVTKRIPKAQKMLVESVLGE